MPVKYRVKTKKDNIGQTVGTKYYAVPVHRGEVDLKQLSEDLSLRSSLTKGDVYATVIGLAEILEEYLHNGYSVRIDNIGIFTLSATSGGFDSPQDCTPHHVHAGKICFRADRGLKKNLKLVKFERE